VGVCRRVGISEQTLYAWKRKYAGLSFSELRKLRQIREENTKLKRLGADLWLDRQMMQEIVQKKLYGPRDRRVLARSAQTTYQVSEHRISMLCRWRKPPYSIGVAVIRRRRCACGCESWR